jgi:hypothetical protein
MTINEAAKSNLDQLFGERRVSALAQTDPN